jgi:hypothetical protein
VKTCRYTCRHRDTSRGEALFGLHYPELPSKAVCLIPLSIGSKGTGSSSRFLGFFIEFTPKLKGGLVTKPPGEGGWTRRDFLSCNGVPLPLGQAASAYAQSPLPPYESTSKVSRQSTHRERRFSQMDGIMRTKRMLILFGKVSICETHHTLVEEL